MNAKEWRRHLDQWPGLKHTDSDIEQMWVDFEAAEAIAERERERAEQLNTELKGAWAGQAVLQARIEALKGCLRRALTSARDRELHAAWVKEADAQLAAPDGRDGPDGPVADHIDGYKLLAGEDGREYGDE